MGDRAPALWQPQGYLAREVLAERLCDAALRHRRRLVLFNGSSQASRSRCGVLAAGRRVRSKSPPQQRLAPRSRSGCARAGPGSGCRHAVDSRISSRLSRGPGEGFLHARPSTSEGTPTGLAHRPHAHIAARGLPVIEDGYDYGPALRGAPSRRWGSILSASSCTVLVLEVSLFARAPRWAAVSVAGAALGASALKHAATLRRSAAPGRARRVVASGDTIAISRAARVLRVRCSTAGALAAHSRGIGGDASRVRLSWSQSCPLLARALLADGSPGRLFAPARRLLRRPSGDGLRSLSRWRGGCTRRGVTALAVVAAHRSRRRAAPGAFRSVIF